MNRLIILLFSITLFLGCNENQNVPLADLPISIIPQPQKMERMSGTFSFEKGVQIDIDKQIEWAEAVYYDLAPKLKKQAIPVTYGGVEADIRIEISETPLVGTEGYLLLVSPDEIKIQANNSHGAFYGVQTLLQLMPPEIFSNKKEENIAWEIPCLKIEDTPRFKYRGMHLDVARHFFDVETVKKFIDQVAARKMNRFHWHLTEDQGWRIEIKKYPKLTEIGGFRNGTLIGHYNDQPHKFDGKRYGGFYTQEEIKEVVEYARKRFVTVIPEIELPGHAQAAITAYPGLGCTGKQLEVLQKWGVSDNVFKPSEQTFEFLENVLTEVMELFPSEYIHIGGDECPKNQWKSSPFCQKMIKEKGLKDEHGLQSYFISRIERFLNSKGRQIIGWDEILEGGLAPNATVMSWRGIEGGIEAAKQRHDVIMTPTSHCYFDYYQSDHPEEPLAIGGFLPLKKVYGYEPVPEELTAEEAKHILGTQANIWTEYMPTLEKMEYMAFPRMDAIAEVAWSQKTVRNFEDFVARLDIQMKRYKYQKINAANHLYELQSSIQSTGRGVELDLTTTAKDAQIRYTTDGSEPTETSDLFSKKILVTQSRKVRAQVFKNGKKAGRGWQSTFDMHLASGKSIKLLNQPHPKYSAGGNTSVINGVLGNDERYGDAEWLGFADGTDFEAVIDLGEKKPISSVDFRFFKGEGQWIYLPVEVSVSVSDDGEFFEQISTLNQFSTDKKVVNVSLPTKTESVQYLKIIVENYGIIPDEKQGGGNGAWLFVDEIRVN